MSKHSSMQGPLTQTMLQDPDIRSILQSNLGVLLRDCAGPKAGSNQDVPQLPGHRACVRLDTAQLGKQVYKTRLPPQLTSCLMSYDTDSLQLQHDSVQPAS